MTASDFDQVFGSKRQPSFAERIGKPEPAANGEAFAGSGEYKPYGFLPTGSLNETCEIRRWMDGTRIQEGMVFPCRLILEVHYTAEELIRLHLPTCLVVIEGRHLGDLRQKLVRRQITFVQQYSVKVWPKAPPKGEPIVEKIQVVRPK